MRFCILRRNSRWPSKVTGKQFFGKVANRLCRYPVGQKFRRNCSISLRFRDKHVFAFYAEIQDGRQKSSVDSTDTLQVKNFVEIAISLHFRDKGVFAFYAEIQDGHQKLQENDF